MSNNKCIRNEYIDFLKGIVIFLMIWAHCIQYLPFDSMSGLWENNIVRYIYSFHMPLFSFISGYLLWDTLRTKGIYHIVYSRCIGLTIPIVVWGSVQYILNIVKGNTSLSVINWIFAVTQGGFWFLYAVMFCSVLIAIIHIWLRNCRNELYAFIIMLILLVISSHWIYSMRMIAYTYPFFTIGFLCNNHKTGMKRILNKYGSFAIVLFPLALLYFHEDEYIYNTGIDIFTTKRSIIDQIVIDFFRWGLAAVGICFVIVVTKNIYICFKDKKIVSIIIETGKYSLQLYVMSSIIISGLLQMLLSMYFQKYFENTNVYINCYVFAPVLSYIIIKFLTLISKKMENTILGKILFGRM